MLLWCKTKTNWGQYLKRGCPLKKKSSENGLLVTIEPQGDSKQPVQWLQHERPRELQYQFWGERNRRGHAWPVHSSSFWPPWSSLSPAVCKKCGFPGTGSQNRGDGAKESLCYSGLVGNLIHTTDVGWEPLDEWVPATRSHLQEPRYQPF